MRGNEKQLTWTFITLVSSTSKTILGGRARTYRNDTSLSLRPSSMFLQYIWKDYIQEGVEDRNFFLQDFSYW